MLDDPEGRLCRCCGEGTYQWVPNPHMRISSCEDDRLLCDVCGEEPMTFEEANGVKQEADGHHAAAVKS